MGDLTSRLRATPPGRYLVRQRMVRRRVAEVRREGRRWLRSSRETTNWTYDLTEVNRSHLAGFVAEVAGIPLRQAAGFLAELAADDDVSSAVRRVTGLHGRPDADPQARFGRRAGWYAIVRANRPALVVETGVDKGLGAVAICAALLRNTAQGHPGRYVGIDINPEAGWLLSEPYTSVAQVITGDVHDVLAHFDGTPNLLISDALHTRAFQRREFELADALMGPSGTILADNAHVDDELYRFALETGRRFLYFQERPRDHWYPGAGIGAAVEPPGAAYGSG